MSHWNRPNVLATSDQGLQQQDEQVAGHPEAWVTVSINEEKLDIDMVPQLRWGFFV
jgi:hypothetical protein